MHKMFEINRTKVKDGYQSGRKVVTQNFKSDLPLAISKNARQLETPCIYNVQRHSPILTSISNTYVQKGVSKKYIVFVFLCLFYSYLAHYHEKFNSAIIKLGTPN